MNFSLRRLLVALWLVSMLPIATSAAARPAAGPGLQGGFAAFWQAHNGAVLFGQPLTGEIQEGGVTVQYCERARLEWHPDYPAGQQIVLGRLGAALTQGRTFPPIAAFRSNTGHLYFAATGHSIQGDILRFWQANGGIPIFGYPLSEELKEDGYTVQYFERARLEHHPELGAAGYRVLPTPLGALALRAAQPAIAFGAAVTVEPPEVSEGYTTVIKVLPAAGVKIIGGMLGSNALAFNCCLPLPSGGGSVGQSWAIAGAPAYQAVGPLPLTITVQLPGGGTQQIGRTVTVRPYPYDTLRSVPDGPRIPPAQRAAELAVIAGVTVGRSGPPLWTGPFALPLHRSIVINAPFGQRRAFVNEPPYEIHTGVDYDAATGTPVYAPAPGRVVFARRLDLRGNTLMLDHGAGVFTLYAHLSAFKVSMGQMVQTGDLIALVGSTGNALGPHLHWEVHASGPEVQPQEWLDRVFPQ